MSDLEELAAMAIECGFAIHLDLGPGLLESCYEALLAARLASAGLAVERQTAVFGGGTFHEGLKRVVNNHGVGRSPPRPVEPITTSQS